MLAHHYGWRVAVGAPALIIAAASGLAFTVLPGHHPDRAKAKARHEGSDDDRDGLLEEGHPPPRMSLRAVATSYPHLLLLGGSYCFIKLVRYLVLLWLPLFLHEQLHFTPAGAGFVSTAFDAGGALVLSHPVTRHWLHAA